MSRVIVLAAFAVWIACAAIRWCTPMPLGHDEARYALAARDLLQGRPARWFYVPVGMTVIGVPGVLAGGSERALRITPLLLGIGLLVAGWRLGVELGGRDAGALTAAVLAGSGQLLKIQIDLLSDLASTACLVAAITVLVHELRHGARWRMLWVAPACAAAFYIRYGSCVAIAIIVAVMLVFGGLDRGVRRAWRQLLATGALFALLIVPHALDSIGKTGSPLGILRDSGGIPPPGKGLAGYLEHPIAYFGVVATLLFVIALLRGWRDRWSLAVVAIGVTDIVVLGMKTLPHTRYVALALVVLVAAGVASTPRRLYPALGAAALVTWIAAFVHVHNTRDLRIAGMRATLAAAPAIAADAHGRPCEVMGRHAVQLEWYTGCHDIVTLPGKTKLVYVVRDDTAGPDQPPAMAGTHVVDRPGFLDIVRL